VRLCSTNAPLRQSVTVAAIRSVIDTEKPSATENSGISVKPTGSAGAYQPIEIEVRDQKSEISQAINSGFNVDFPISDL
jgi:hypothetical protein